MMYHLSSLAITPLASGISALQRSADSSVRKEVAFSILGDQVYFSWGFGIVKSMTRYRIESFSEAKRLQLNRAGFVDLCGRHLSCAT